MSDLVMLRILGDHSAFRRSVNAKPTELLVAGICQPASTTPNIGNGIHLASNFRYSFYQYHPKQDRRARV